MTFLHLLVLVIGTLSAIALADVLGHRRIGPWPLAVLALVLVVAAGFLYSAWLAALSLGLALGVSIVMVTTTARSIARHRRARRQERAQQDSAVARRLGDGARR